MFRESWFLVVTLALIDLTRQCSCQTYPYTDTEIIGTKPTAPSFLYDAGFTVYGNVKTIAVAAEAIEVYAATYAVPAADVNEYTLVASLTGKNTPGTAATELGYAIEGGQSVKTSEVLVGTTIYDSVGGIYSVGTGAAYVFKQHSAKTWSQTARLQPSDLTDGDVDKFGASAAMDEFDPTRLLIGAPLAAADNSGAVYFFQSSPSATYWTEGQKLMPANPVANSRFGDKVEMFGRFAAITQPETCEVYIFEQERPAPKKKPKVSCDSSPTPSPVIATWKPLVQHETLRWSQQQVLNFTNQPDYNCDVGGRTQTNADGTNSTFDTGESDDDPVYGSGSEGYGGYLSLSMFEDTLAIGVPGYESGTRVRTDYRDATPDPTLCQYTCRYYSTSSNSGGPTPVITWTPQVTTSPRPAAREDCCPTVLACAASPGANSPYDNTVTTNGGPLYIGQCPEFSYAPGDNGIVYIYDMETFKGDCDRENYFPTVLSFDELVNLRDSDNDNTDKDDDCVDHHVHKPKPKPQCEVSRWSMQASLTSPSPTMNGAGRDADCQNFGYKVDVYKDVVTVNEINTLSFDIDPTSYETFPTSASPYPVAAPVTLVDEYHCMSGLYWPQYSRVSPSPTQPTVKEGFVYAYEKTSSNTWSHIGAAPGYEINTDPTGIEATNTKVVGTDIFTMESNATSYTVDVQNTDNTWHCMVVTLMDQFGDGWGGAELQITDSDGRKQTFAPYCDSVNNFEFSFRWCPDDWQDGSEVKMEILHSPSTKFRWELEWSVLFEWNNQILYGDWETKMSLSYDTVGSQVLRLKHAEHLINTSAVCVECELYTASPTGAPSSKPIPIPPKPKPQASTRTKSPTPTHASKSSKSLSTREFEEDHDSKDMNGEDVEGKGAVSYDEGDLQPLHLRHLHHKAAVRTHSPTMTPAPTMTQLSFDTWEQIVLGSTDTWDRPYDLLGPYATPNIPMKYFISDKEGKHLYYEGSKCSAGAMTCWNDLPTGDRDYVLRVGGGATTATSPVESWSMCGITGGRMEQLDFRVKDYITSNLNSEECDALLHVTQSTYCQNTFALSVPLSGIIVLENLVLDSFSQVDLELLGHAISLIFSPSTVLEVTFEKHMHSSRGAHVGFTVYVPSVLFGLDATEFDTLNATSVNAKRLMKSVNLASSVDTLLLDLSALGLESNLNKHGKIYFEDISSSNLAKATYVRDPFYYVDDDEADVAVTTLGGSQASDNSSLSVLVQVLTAIQGHTLAFLVIVMGAAVVFVRRRSQEEDDDVDVLSFHKSERKRRKNALVNLPVDGKRSSSRHSSGSGSGKKDKHESKHHKHRHRDKKLENATSTTPVEARIKALDYYVAEMESKPPTTRSASETDKHAQRFVPYGRAAELAAEEGWTSGQRTAGARGGSSTSHGKEKDSEDGDEEYGDELDNILSQFDSSSSGSSDSSDDWEHA